MMTDIDFDVVQSWQVPAFDVVFWQGRSRDFCVVIPVINEGFRIANLIARMSQQGVHESADLIIVDGGSTDSSLVPDKLLEIGVRGLLVKTGPGKLSAQLRSAYAFSLQQGYEGILTIDGNDKDDPEAIPRFIQALQKGFDFIQASRFIPGGAAFNTPLLRNLAIRFLHAPLLSLASGYRWTDTTQGFRGYSRQLLLDARIAPFRDVFITYELLAYLSYRAPRLDYHCIELPTIRRYPEGSVPTKISGIKDNLSLILILVKACFGFYNPSR